MLIDFHTHTFPEDIAARALNVLSQSERLTPFTMGTNSSLMESMGRAGVDKSILLPVVTKVLQTEEINKIASQVEEKTGGRLISFGGIHPEDENYDRHLRELKDSGIRGIKLHPVFQKTNLDDISYKRIISKASELGLVIMVHAGYDISCPDAEYATAKRIIPLVRELKPEKMVLAHMGTWKNWEEAEEVACECKGVYFDTAFVLSPDGRDCFFDTDIKAMKAELFCKIVRSVGADKVLFGTDSPWTDQSGSIEVIKKSGLTAQETDWILGRSAQQLLDLT